MWTLIKLLVPKPQLFQEKHMDTRIVAVYCLCDDMLKALHYKDDVQCQMTGVEVMTTAIIAALDYSGNLEKARKMLQSGGYIPRMLSKSRFNRRWHRDADLYLALFSQLRETWKQLNGHSIYVIDSFLWLPAITIAFNAVIFTEMKLFGAIRPAKGVTSMG
jgi:hypothetical protein